MALATLLIALPVMAADPAELEVQLQQLKADIAEIQTRLDSDLANRDALQAELARAARALDDAERKRRETHRSLQETNRRIVDLESRIDQLTVEASQIAALLGAQLRLAYQQGGQSRLKLLLNQDDPRDLARQMAYHGYLSRARLALLAQLERVRTTLAEDRAALGQEQRQLVDLEARQRRESVVLETARQERDAALLRVEERIESQTARLAEMERAAAELQSLIEELAIALREIPMDVEVPSILSLQGGLAMPIAGALKRRFGEARGGELRWNGWLIEAASGTEASAVAHGRVAYADWLRGYGMLLIIDHGDGVMSLYGHNESLLRRVGDWVAPGDPIAIVGQSGAAGETGLYFELRRDGRPVNPSAWFARQ